VHWPDGGSRERPRPHRRWAGGGSEGRRCGGARPPARRLAARPDALCPPHRVIAAFASWLFRIVERECRRLLGLQRRTVPLENADPSALRIEPVPSDLRRDLGAMIAALPDLYREVLILRDIEELTAPEAAAQLDISVEAVKSRLHRARGMLREKLLGSGYWSS